VGVVLFSCGLCLQVWAQATAGAMLGGFTQNEEDVPFDLSTDHQIRCRGMTRASAVCIDSRSTWARFSTFGWHMLRLAALPLAQGTEEVLVGGQHF
jgi:hypothetical protein